MDEIRIENLRVYAHHGVYREENEKGQNFYINATLETDTRKAGILDDLGLSTNYGEVCKFLHRFLKEHTYKLIETVAETAAEALLLHFPLVKNVTLEVRKPEAPIPLSFESVSVKISRGWRKAYLACGSNMGDKKGYLDGAVRAFRSDIKCRVLRVSDWIVTAPYGGVEQDDFLNGAMEIETLYTPRMLLEKIHEIESAYGRERKVHWGPRTLDIDILLYEDRMIDEEDLMIPHVDMHNRDFVLGPLAQIAPYKIHPLFGKSILQMYEEHRKHVGDGGLARAAEGREAQNMWARKLTLEEAGEIYTDYLKGDFPPAEIKPFSIIEKMWKKGCYQAYGFYEEEKADKRTGEKEETDGAQPLCAYAFLLANKEEHVLLLDYFAVCRQKRGKGYGSLALSLLQKECAGFDALVIEVEDDELDDIDEEVRLVRKRRISFYTHAGCVMTSTRSRVWGVDYRIMALPLLDTETQPDMADKVTALYGGMYNKEAMKKHFAITAL